MYKLAGNSQRTRLSENRFRQSLFTCIIMLYNLIILGQSTDRFNLDSAFVIQAPIQRVTVTRNFNPSISNDGQRCLIFTGINHAKYEIYFHEIDTHTYKTTQRTIEYKKSDKIDPRYPYVDVFWDLDNNPWLLVQDWLYCLNKDFNAIKSRSKLTRDKESSRVFFTKNGLCFGKYYNSGQLWATKHKNMEAYLELWNEKQVLEKRVDPNTGYIGLVHTSRNNLIAFNDKFFVWPMVSEPVLYVYDHRLNYIDSLYYNPPYWSSIDTMAKADSSFSFLTKMDYLAAGREAFSRGVSKTTDVSFINDSTLICSWTKGFEEVYQQTFQIDLHGRIHLIGEPVIYPVTGKVLGKDEYYPFYLGSGTWNMAKDLMVEVRLDNGLLPWDKSEEPPISKDYVYLELYFFHYSNQRVK